MLAHFVAQAEVHQEGFGGIEVGQQVGGVDFVSGAVAVFGLHHTLYHDLSVGNVLLVEEAVGVVDVGDDGVQLVQVVVEAGSAVVAVLVLVVEAELEVAGVVPLPAHGEVGIPLFFVQAAEVAHGLLAVQLEEPEAAVVVLDVHHLAAVGFFATGLAVRASPGQLPPVALAEVMDSVQLMVLQGVYVHDVVAAGQLVSFGISTFAALVGVDGVAGVEESVAYAVAPAQGVAQVAEGGELQFLRKAVVGEVVLHGAGGLECLVEGIFHVLVAVAGAEGGEQAECLVAYTEVLAEAEVPAQFGQRTLLAGAEGGIEDIAGLHVFVKLHQGHAEGGCVHSGCLQERAAAVHLIAVFA